MNVYVHDIHVYHTLTWKRMVSAQYLFKYDPVNGDAFDLFRSPYTK